MSLALDIASWVLILTGSVFCMLGGLGIVRLPEFYARTHAGGMTDTLGAGLLLWGLILQAGWTLVSLKLVFIGLFLFITSPTASHALVKAAYAHGTRAVVDDEQPVPARSMKDTHADSL